jgi:PAS domain S-box-containing protein
MVSDLVETKLQQPNQHDGNDYVAPSAISTVLPGGAITLFASFAVIVIAGLFYLIERFEKEQQTNSLLRTAEEMSQSISNFRQFYSQEIVSRLKNSNINVTHDYESRDNAIPLPATMTIEYGKFLEHKGSGSGSRLYSSKPFPWRADRTLDEFAKVALERLENGNEKSFYRFETLQGKKYLRYATPVVMQESCVDCHNMHPETPFAPWYSGDVRGIQEILIERDSQSSHAAIEDQSFRNIVFFILSTFSIAFASILILAKRNRRAFSELKSLARLEQTERLQVVDAMKQVKEGLARHEAVLGSASDGIITIDENGVIETVNPAAELIFGYTSSEMRNNNVAMLMPSEHGEMHDNYLKNFLATGQSQIIGKGREVIGKRKDGNEFPMELSVSEVKLGDRKLFTGIVRDITERKQSEQALQQSEAQARQLSMVASHTDNAVIFTDHWGNIEWVNAGFTRISGYRLDEVVGKKPGTILQGPGTNRAVVEKISSAIKNRQGFKEELLNYHKNGEPYWISIEAHPILDEHGELLKFMAIERDITSERTHKQEIEQARIKAEEANNAKSRFLAMMSHEIRTPLNGVIGTLGLLRETDLTSEQKKFVETGRHSAENLLTIINDILSFSKLEAGKDELETSVFNLGSLVESVREVLSTKAKEKSISLTTVINADVPEYVEGDAGRIRQVLLNLASNAVKFTDQGEVRLEVSSAGVTVNNAHNLRFTVTDTGVGISTENQRKLFNEFWTMSSSYNMTGTGLGLAISKNLVKLMSGHIDMKSAAGKGSSFWFEIPLKTPSQSDISNIISSKSAQENQRKSNQLKLRGRILLAEDNPTNQMIAVAMLKSCGLRVDTVGNGLEAVEAIKTRPYDIILMDIGMPEMDGIEATQHIRDLEGAASSIPIIAMTAHVMKGDREKILSQGLDDYISKPVTKDELIACIENWLTMKNTRPNQSTHAKPVEDPNTSKRDIIDSDKLEQLFRDTNHENTAALVDAFINEMKARLEKILMARKENDLDVMVQESHALKSCSASYGADRLSSMAAELESAGLNNASQAAMDIADQMPEVVHKTRSELLAYIVTSISSQQKMQQPS